MSKIPPELEAEMTPTVKAFVLALLERIDELESQVERLTPRTSSLPPSTEHPHAKPTRKTPSGKERKQGGQKGHKRHLRDLIPSEQCTTVTPCHPDGCRRCGGQLQPDSADPQRHQAWDLPPIEPIAAVYRTKKGSSDGSVRRKFLRFVDYRPGQCFGHRSNAAENLESGAQPLNSRMNPKTQRRHQRDAGL